MHCFLRLFRENALISWFKECITWALTRNKYERIQPAQKRAAGLRLGAQVSTAAPGVHSPPRDSGGSTGRQRLPAPSPGASMSDKLWLAVETRAPIGCPWVHGKPCRLKESASVLLLLLFEASLIIHAEWQHTRLTWREGGHFLLFESRDFLSRWAGVTCSEWHGLTWVLRSLYSANHRASQSLPCPPACRLMGGALQQTFKVISYFLAFTFPLVAVIVQRNVY